MITSLVSIIFFILLSLFVRHLVRRAQRGRMILRVSYEHKSSSSSDEIEADIERLTDRHHYRSWRKLLYGYIAVVLLILSVSLLSERLERLSLEPVYLKFFIFVVTSVVSLYAIKDELFEHTRARKMFYEEYKGAAGISVLHVALQVVFFFLSNAMFSSMFDHVKYGYLKSVRAIERPSQILKSDVGVDYYLIKDLQLSQSVSPLYDYDTYRGLEVTVLQPLRSDAGSDDLFLTKRYNVLNRDQSAEDIQRDIQSDLYVYTQEPVCVSSIPESHFSSTLRRILKRPGNTLSPQTMLVLESVDTPRITSLTAESQSSLNSRGSEASACDDLTVQDSLIYLINTLLLLVLITVFYGQILSCRKLILTHIKYYET